jgi:hypothetical protein
MTTTPPSPPLTRPVPNWTAAATVALSLALVGGCGGGATDRCDISGMVTLDRVPLANGAITFRPVGAGQTTGATIEAGEFAIVGEKGPKFGKYRVEILAYRPTGKKIPDPDNPGALADEIEQVIPARYNRDSQLEIEITPQSNRELKFDLKSK